MSTTTIAILVIVVAAVMIALSARSGPKVTRITTRLEKEDRDDA